MGFDEDSGIATTQLNSLKIPLLKTVYVQGALIVQWIISFGNNRFRVKISS